MGAESLAAARAPHARPLRARRRATARRAGLILADTKFELGPGRRRRPRAGRRGGHPRLLAPVAGRPLAPGAEPALLRQAVPARLARRDRLGPRLAAAASCRPRSWRGPGARYVEAHDRIAEVIGVTQVVVTVMPKEGVLDPQGQAVRGALAQLGFAGVGRRAHRQAHRAGDRRRRPRRPGPRDVRAAAGERADRGLPRWRPPSDERRHRPLPGLARPRQRPPRRRAAWAAGPSTPGTPTPSCRRARRAVLLPGRLLLRRPPALRRHRQPRADHGAPCGATPRPAGASSASATASRCSARPGCCPGRCAATRPSRSSAARWTWRSADADTPWTGGLPSRRAPVDPDQEQRGRLVRRPVRGAGGAALRPGQPARLDRPGRRHRERARAT